MATGTIAVRGYRELSRDFKRMDKQLLGDLRVELRKAAEPVRTGAERYALGRIRNMPRSPDWAGMRIGVTAKSVYVVPSQRGRGRRKRSNLADLLLDRAMNPALEENQGEVVNRIDNMLGRLGGDYGF